MLNPVGLWSIGQCFALRQGRAAHGDGRDGRFAYGFTGPTSTGEEGTLKTCQTLALAWNQQAQPDVWVQPSTLTNDPSYDCLIQRLDGQPPARAVQVVRAVADPAHWKQIKVDGGIEKTGVSAQDLAALLRQPIERKTEIDPKTRAGLVLALNAIDTPVVAFTEVVEAFAANSGAWAATQGFAEIWLVGPVLKMVHRLA